MLEQAVAGEDRGLEAQRQRDGIRRTRVDLNHLVAAIDVQLGVVRVVFHLRDDDFPQLGAQSHDDLFQEVVRERAAELHARELHGDGARLRRTDPDREHPLAHLGLDRTTNTPVVILQEMEGERVLPIWIGSTRSPSISCRITTGVLVVRSNPRWATRTWTRSLTCPRPRTRDTSAARGSACRWRCPSPAA